MGSEDSPTRMAMLEAVEKIMVEEGYASVTSRRVAEVAGLKQQLVYYYFKTMDDLILTAYRRHTARVFEQFEKVLASPQSLHAYWEISTDSFGTALSVEYMALANHNEAIRRETRLFGERLRVMQAKAIPRLPKKLVIETDTCPPAVISTTLNSIANTLIMETGFGMSYGHAETFAFIESVLNQIEPGDAAAPKRPTGGRKKAR